MINLVESPQRADMKAVFECNNDILTVKIGDTEEEFDFTGLDEGIAEEVTTEVLPVNPIVDVNKTENVVNITVIRFYAEDEKPIFEVGAEDE